MTLTHAHGASAYIELLVVQALHPPHNRLAKRHTGFAEVVVLCVPP